VAREAWVGPRCADQRRAPLGPGPDAGRATGRSSMLDM